MLVLTVVDEMCSFFKCGTATNVRFLACAESLHAGVHCSLKIFQKMAGGRQEARHREAGRAKSERPMWPVKLQLIQPCCSFHLLPILVHRNRHLCRAHNCRQNLRFDAWWSHAENISDGEGQHESGKGRMVPCSTPLCHKTKFAPQSLRLVSSAVLKKM